MRRPIAAAGSATHFLLAPGVVAGLVPWWLTGWQTGWPPYPAPLRIAGLALLVASVVAVIHAFVQFVVEGDGTPAPVAPTGRLVVGGLYRYVRNPMYLAVVAAIAAQALLLSQPGLLVYAAAAWIVMGSFAHWYEEPTLRRQFGAEYEAYHHAVPAWLPRLHPWRGEEPHPR
jgi:protein-S-isoprenylcysteine O-methyltransferase Ste14